MVTSEDLMSSLETTKPSQMTGISSDVDRTSSWGDFAGYSKVKEKLHQLVDWPLSHPDAFKTLGVTPPSGVLLYGPSGCGKSALMKILAATSHINVITLKG